MVENLGRLQLNLPQTLRATMALPFIGGPSRLRGQEVLHHHSLALLPLASCKAVCSLLQLASSLLTTVLCIGMPKFLSCSKLAHSWMLADMEQLPTRHTSSSRSNNTQTQ